MPWIRPSRRIAPSIFGDALRGHFLAWKDWLSRLCWVVRHPHDPARDHDIYILKHEARSYLRHYCVPFQRCTDCGRWTRRWWRYQPCPGSDCIPF